MLDDEDGQELRGAKVERRLDLVTFEGLLWLGVGVQRAVDAAEREIAWRERQEAEGEWKDALTEEEEAWVKFCESLPTPPSSP